MQAKPIFDLAARQLADTSGTRWPQSTLAAYLSWTLAEMAGLLPDSVAELDKVALVDGAEQDVPADVIRWIGAVRNMGGGTSPGAAVRNADLELVEALDPNWFNRSPANVVRDCYFSLATPRKFYVYPPVTTTQGAVYLQFKAAKVPPDGATLDSTPTTELPVTDDYFAIVLNGVLAFAYAEDTSQTSSEMANHYAKAFYQGLGQDKQAKARAQPALKEAAQ